MITIWFLKFNLYLTGSKTNEDEEFICENKNFICVLKNLRQRYFFKKEDAFVFVKYVFPNKKRSIQMVQE